MNANTLIGENIYFSVGARNILRGATIRADKGRITGLLGRNGSGKSSMLKAVFGAEKVDECDVYVDGKKIRAPYLADRLLCYAPQFPFLPSRQTPAAIAGQLGVDVQAIIDLFPELETEMNKRINELSGGRERLITVLMILMADVQFVFLDEPFTFIMPIHIDRLKQLLLSEKERKGIIVTDHIYKHVLSVSDSLYLMKEGSTILLREQDDLVLHGYVNQLVT